MYTIEAFYFPTQIILIDDDAGFLKILASKLSENFLVKTFNNPNDALAYLQEKQSLQNIINPNTLVDEELEFGERYLSLSKMNALAENKTKYEMATVIISDYIMPEMNGVEFFEKISNVPVMKILLTGNADLDLALYAFNRGVVDKFLVKKSQKLLTEVEESIIACQHGFFRKYSYPLLSSLSLPNDSMLNTNALSTQLEKIIQDYDIVEYYLIDNIGSYLLITKTGKHIYFMCMIERQFDEYLNIANNGGASSDVIEKLKSKTHAPVFLAEGDYKLSAQAWENIVYRFDKKDGYYFCVLNQGI
ncbi:MAG: hypothetical protein V4496_02015 [Pseudomonadota bacterium]